MTAYVSQKGRMRTKKERATRVRGIKRGREREKKIGIDKGENFITGR